MHDDVYTSNLFLIVVSREFSKRQNYIFASKDRSFAQQVSKYLVSSNYSNILENTNSPIHDDENKQYFWGTIKGSKIFYMGICFAILIFPLASIYIDIFT